MKNTALIATDDLCKNESKYLAKKLRSTVILHYETYFHLCDDSQGNTEVQIFEICDPQVFFEITAKA